jgi:hypothetical protein
MTMRMGPRKRNLQSSIKAAPVLGGVAADDSQNTDISSSGDVTRRINPDVLGASPQAAGASDTAYKSAKSELEQRRDLTVCALRDKASRTSDQTTTSQLERLAQALEKMDLSGARASSLEKLNSGVHLRKGKRTNFAERHGF